MRREFIYPHRSVRSYPISRIRLYGGICAALLLSAAIFYFGSFLLAGHNRITCFILQFTGIPSSGTVELEVFPQLGPVSVPFIPLLVARLKPLRTIGFFSAVLLALILIYRRFPLSRNFVIFLFILLGAAAVAIIISPSFNIDSGTYSQIWLRGEVLVWILLPWVSAFLFILTLPSMVTGVGWMLLVQVYSIVWSAARLAFCLGVLHYTGMLFLPILWFCFGVLFDLVYILVFYSLAVHVSIRRAMGGRRS